MMQQSFVSLTIHVLDTAVLFMQCLDDVDLKIDQLCIEEDSKYIYEDYNIWNLICRSKYVKLSNCHHINLKSFFEI